MKSVSRDSLILQSNWQQRLLSISSENGAANRSDFEYLFLKTLSVRHLSVHN